MSYSIQNRQNVTYNIPDASYLCLHANKKDVEIQRIYVYIQLINVDMLKNYMNMQPTLLLKQMIPIFFPFFTHKDRA